ncbi:hypothetical protein HY546_01280 [archaeon]|nr:hypothetical protein [archaeon]
MIVKRVVFKTAPKEIFEWLSKHSKTQVVSSRIVAGERHVIHCVNQTFKAFDAGENIASKQEIDFVLRLVGERQIRKALEQAKPKKDCVFVCWNNGAGKAWKDFCGSFSFLEKPLREPPRAKLLEALEKSATFWLFQ